MKMMDCDSIDKRRVHEARRYFYGGKKAYGK
jgi:hypothetical protein